MNNIKFINLLCLMIFGITASAQNEKITFVILKGSAIVDNSGKNIELNKSERITLKKEATVKMFPNSAAIAYNNKVKIEYRGIKDQNLTYLQISNSLNKIKPETLTSNFFAYLDKMYFDIEDKNNSYGASIGAASRGIEDNSLKYLPNDESIILSDTLLLTFANELTKLASNIIVTNENTNEMVFNNRPQGNDVKLFGLNPGNYNWTYKIESNGKNVQFKNTFSIPNVTEKQSKLKEISDFKESINNCTGCFSEETKKILLNDFIEKNKFYIN